MSDLSKLRFGSFSIAEAEKEKESLTNQKSDYMKLEGGDNVVRFLPAGEPGNAPYTKVFQHFINRGPADRPIVFNCPKRMNGGHCPACAKADALISTGNEADKKEAMKWYPKMRVFYNVIDRNNEAEGPKVLGVGKMIHEKLLSLLTNARAGGDFFDPVGGFDVVITKSGSGIETRYEVNGVRNASPLVDKVETAQDWIDNQDNHQVQAYVPTTDEVMAKLAGDTPADRPSALPPAKTAAALPAQVIEVQATPVAKAAPAAADDDLEDFGL